ncbi:hypothetical protein BT63DRAFT_437337 [Microthyrium microscopicum]|uniref:Gcp-like domain-containing protein n=1 Tax=Microthyrium microscopicum TaxID=703497 RepID=A0A6A6UN51_9PEZI|nr:hypothetical protein BT63DRAFT_437337 [Microthyrium microscopicum]
MKLYRLSQTSHYAFHRTLVQTISSAIRRRGLLTLAIETSCDDTAVAIVEKNGAAARLHFNQRITADQGPLLGIHPIVALEGHEKTLAGLLNQALPYLPRPAIPANGYNSSTRCIEISEKDGSSSLRKAPDFISVTRGPGMRTSLNTGLHTAKGLSVAWQVPLVGVHHMQAHALTSRLVNALDAELPGKADFPNTNLSPKPEFPFLSLLVSGGHTLLVRSEDLVTHKILANTGDYAIGDCLDKIGRFLLPEELIASSKTPSYGPILEKFAFPNGSSDYSYDPPKSLSEERARAKRPTSYGWYITLPLAISRAGSRLNIPEFSFTGIESQAQRIAERGWDKALSKWSKQNRTSLMPEAEARCLAQETMKVAFGQIASRIVLALEEEKSHGSSPSKTLVLSGGVASNKFLRYVIQQLLRARGFGHIEICAPPIALCTDNAAMIGWAGCEMYEAGHISSLGIRVLGKWSMENIVSPENEIDGRGWIENNLKSPSVHKPSVPS